MNPWIIAVGVALASTTALAEPSPAPLFAEATRQFTTMRDTLYQHRTQVNLETGSYRYDCVGFVSHALRNVTPDAWKSVATANKLAPGRIPSPPKYQAFFAGLAAHPAPGWKAVTRAADLQPGDIVAWENRTPTSSGHAVVVGAAPVKAGDGSWTVMVYDSTSSPHGEDSRPTDQRAGILESNGRRSGLGHGVMVFLSDKETGALTGLRWGPKSKAILVPIAAARPVS